MTTNISQHNTCHDHSKDDNVDISTKTKGGVKIPFPENLFQMLQHIDLHEEPDLASIVWWQSHGRYSLVRDIWRFEEHILTGFPRRRITPHFVASWTYYASRSSQGMVRTTTSSFFAARPLYIVAIPEMSNARKYWKRLQLAVLFLMLAMASLTSIPWCRFLVLQLVLNLIMLWCCHTRRSRSDKKKLIWHEKIVWPAQWPGAVWSWIRTPSTTGGTFVDKQELSTMAEQSN